MFCLCTPQRNPIESPSLLLMATQLLCECTKGSAMLDSRFFGHVPGKPWIEHCRFIESRPANERQPSRGLLLCLDPPSGACRPERVCGCFSICHHVGRPRCFFRSHSGNRCGVQSQTFDWHCEHSQPILKAVVRRIAFSCACTYYL